MPASGSEAAVAGNESVKRSEKRERTFIMTGR